MEDLFEVGVVKAVGDAVRAKQKSVAWFNALAIEKNQKHTAFCNSPPNCFGPKSSAINHNRPKGDRLPKATPKE